MYEFDGDATAGELTFHVGDILYIIRQVCSNIIIIFYFWSAYPLAL